MPYLQMQKGRNGEQSMNENFFEELRENLPSDEDDRQKRELETIFLKSYLAGCEVGYYQGYRDGHSDGSDKGLPVGYGCGYRWCQIENGLIDEDDEEEQFTDHGVECKECYESGGGGCYRYMLCRTIEHYKAAEENDETDEGNDNDEE